MKLLLKRALFLLLAFVPVLAMAAHSGGHSYSHGGFGGPVHYIRGPVYRPHYYSTFGLGIGLGYALGAPYYYDYPYAGGYYGPPREVIIEHNTYVEEPAPGSDTRVYSNRQEPSLLRDLQGRCYQRTYDSNGRELRTELDPSECNF
jgi:hypothetical protein